MKVRLDQLVLDRGLAPSLDAAMRIIVAGAIRVDGAVADKPGRAYDSDARVELIGTTSKYVSRGGLKLEAALERFGLGRDASDAAPAGKTGLDIGASTGGFTDCMLQGGAARVIAVDTGRGQIHDKLRTDPRVTLMERTNARNLTLDAIGGAPVDLIAIDVSFISLRLILPPCEALLAPEGDLIALVKPQFEAPRRLVGEGGIVRDPEVHREVLERICRFCRSGPWAIGGLMASPIRGARGNVEFLLWLRRGGAAEAVGEEAGGEDVSELIGQALEEAAAEAGN